jgi:histidinol-phosphate aminotransferase
MLVKKYGKKFVYFVSYCEQQNLIKTFLLLPMQNLKFIRSDLSQLNAYKPHPGSDSTEPVNIQFDRLDTNESPLDLPPEIKEKLAWTYQQIIETNRYPDGGHESLKNAISEYVNESANLSNSTFTAANISVGNGSDELIRSLLIATCLRGEGSILVANPTFSMYAILAQTLGISVVTIGRNQHNFETDLEAANSAISHTQNPPIRVVFVVHPNSPTANCLTAAEITWLKSLPEEILVVIDEAYFEFSQTTLAAELLQHPHWIILRTFSKAFRLAAMRVGYCIAHPQAIAILEKVRLPYNLPSFSIASALMALENRQLLLQSIPQTLNERAKLITALSAQSILEITPSRTNFIYLRVKTDYQDTENHVLTNLNQKLRSQGTLIRLLPNGLRITIGTPAENSRTIERIQAALS